MREVIFKDMTTKKRNKRSLAVSESFNRGCLRYLAERKTLCKIRKILRFESGPAARKWIAESMKKPSEHQRISLMRIFDSKKGIKIWKSKAVGVLYINSGPVVVYVLFMQTAALSVQAGTKNRGR
ncbi:hypothetical protein ACFL0T_06990 [Candidatus Omnitrophota bacterium]